MPRYRLEISQELQPETAIQEPPLRPDWRDVPTRSLPASSEISALLLKNPRSLFFTSGVHYPWIGISSNGEIMVWGPTGYLGIYGPDGELLPWKAQIRQGVWGRTQPPRPAPKPPPKYIWKPPWMKYWGIPVWGGGWDMFGNWFLYE